MLRSAYFPSADDVAVRCRCRAPVGAARRIPRAFRRGQKLRRRLASGGSGVTADRAGGGGDVRVHASRERGQCGFGGLAAARRKGFRRVCKRGINGSSRMASAGSGVPVFAVRHSAANTSTSAAAASQRLW